MKFRKKPIIVEATRFDGFVGEGSSCPAVKRIIKIINGIPELLNVIPTLEGDMIVHKGDWIIKGVKGEFYPCKPAIFKATYDPIDDEEQTPLMKDRKFVYYHAPSERLVIGTEREGFLSHYIELENRHADSFVRAESEWFLIGEL